MYRSSSKHMIPWRLSAFMVLLAAIATTSATHLPRRPNNKNINNCLACIHKLRGGAPPPYEPNPSYNHKNAPTLADVDKNGFYHTTTAFQSPLQQKPPPLTQLIGNYFAELHKFSPTLFNGTLASLLLFLTWQFPTSSIVTKILRNHFVCSHYNLVKKRRYHTLVLAAFSHASFRHLALNMYAFVTFGGSVKQILTNHGVNLWPFVLTSAIFANIVFLLFDKGQGGSCIGLSGVTLALLAFDSLVYPTKELRMFVSFIPITLPAYYLFLGLLGFSALGILGMAGRSNVAHSTHLGGLIYGYLFYNAFKRGWVRLWNYRVRKAYHAIRGG